jgi:hypothetical protein
MSANTRAGSHLGAAVSFTAVCVAVLAACGGSASDEGATPIAAAAQRTDLPAAAAHEAVAQSASPRDAPALPNLLPAWNDSGFAATFSLAGAIDRSGPFFQSLGSNGRSCVTCHALSDGWTITPASVQARFVLSAGTDPIFRTNDGANTPTADVSTLRARRAAYSMLLSKAVIRVGIGIPDGAEFELAQADDPYGFASSRELSLFRRPLPTTSLRFLSAVMWDGRETFRDANSPSCVAGTTTCYASIHFDLANQSNDATVGHAQAAQALTAEQREAIVAFESDLFTAQAFDWRAGGLSADGARGGPVALSQTDFYFGSNDTLAGDYRTQAPFTPNVMTLFDGWSAPAARVQPSSVARRCSTASRSASAASRASTTTSPSTRSPAPAPPATTHPTQATIRSRCRWTSALPMPRAARRTCRCTRCATR